MEGNVGLKDGDSDSWIDGIISARNLGTGEYPYPTVVPSPMASANVARASLAWKLVRLEACNSLSVGLYSISLPDVQLAAKMLYPVADTENFDEQP